VIAMSKLFLCVFVVLLAGCATGPPPPPSPSLTDQDPCAKGESSWDCQVDRYGKVNQ
jgi:hypothetical protein